MAMNKIFKLWSELDQVPNQGLYKRLYASGKPFYIYATYQYPEKYYGIAFVVSNNYGINIKPFENLKDLKVSLMADRGFSNSRLLSIQLMSSANKDVFATLCEDVIQSVIDIVSESERVNTIVNQLFKWKSMFDKINSNGLSQSEQQGLFGELNLLHKMLSKTTLQHYDILQSWVGIDKALRDFQGTSWAIEVKTTATGNPQKIIVNNERQLDETLLDSLYLYHCSVETSKANGVTLYDKINEIRGVISSDIPILTIFNAKLFEAGYADAQSELYKDLHYKIRSENFYQIKDDFPRIKENELRDGVGNVTYSVVLAQCNNYLVSEKQVILNIQNK